MIEQLPSKFDTTLKLLEEGSVFVHLDPRKSSALVPKHYKNQPQLVLQIGLQMAVPILDLVVDEEGIEGTLTFSRIPFKCFAPWEVIFAVFDEDGKGMVWPESLPPEIVTEIEKENGIKVSEDRRHQKQDSKKTSNVIPLFGDVKPQALKPVPVPKLTSVPPQKPKPDDDGPKPGGPNLRIIE